MGESRFEYGCVEDPVSVGLWIGRVNSAIRGKRGQRLLRGLEAALLAMPEHKLCRGDVATPDWGADGDGTGGQVCALGALAVYQDMQRLQRTWAEAQAELAEYAPEGAWETAELGQHLGFAWALAWEIGMANDEETRGLSEEARWEYMLAWVRARLRVPA